MWLVVLLSVWLAQLYIFRCEHVSQLPQFKSVASDTVSESSRFLVQVFELMLRVTDWIFWILVIFLSWRAFYSVFFIPERQREREPSSVSLKLCTLPQWLLHPGFEPPLQFTLFPAGEAGAKFEASFPFKKKWLANGCDLDNTTNNVCNLLIRIDTHNADIFKKFTFSLTGTGAILMQSPWIWNIAVWISRLCVVFRRAS